MRINFIASMMVFTYEKYDSSSMGKPNIIIQIVEIRVGIASALQGTLIPVQVGEIY